MTLARLIETGSGSLAVRLVIEGLPIEFVSDPGMEKTTSDGRRRVCCLPPMGEGLVIEDSVNIQEATLEAQGVSVDLTETKDEALSQVFRWRPSVERFITTTVATGDTAVLLLSVDGISADDVVHIGTEAMLVTNVGAGVITVTRAHWQTIAQKHWSNDGAVPYRVLTNRPARIRGRRAFLYLYSDGDNLQGDGTQVWIGHVTRDPMCDEAGTKWRLQLGSIAERLKGKLGGELDVPLRPRGISYTWASPIVVLIVENDVPIVSGSRYTGFHETQRDFVESFNAWLATETAAADNTYEVVESDHGWTVRVTVDVTTTQLQIYLVSMQDGVLSGSILSGSSVGHIMQSIDGTIVSAVSVSDVVYPIWHSALGWGNPDPRSVPRGYFGRVPEPHVYLFAEDPASQATAPSNRIYLERAMPADADVVRVHWADGFAHEYRISDSDTGDNWIELRNDVPAGGSRFHSARYGATTLPTIQPLREIASGTLADLRDGLVTNGPLYCNRAAAPFLTTSDLADWSDVIDEAARGVPWLLSRLYTLFGPVDLDEMLAHEMRLYQVFPIIDSSGKIGVSSIARATAGGTATVIDDEIISAGWSTSEVGGQTINRVVVSLGYDPQEDDWALPQVETIDMTSFAQDHVDRTLEIQPRSRAARGDSTILAEEVSAVVLPVIILFGSPYELISVHVSWKLFSLRCGDAVLFSAIHLPDARNGVRPMDDVRGIVVGRHWELGKEHGRLTILVHGLNTAGYAPTARVVDKTDNGGDEWTIEVDDAMYAPAGTAADEFFEAGDKVRAIQYDSESPTIVTGTVVSVDTTTHEIDVQFDATWTPGASTWELCFANRASVQESQEVYAFIAESDGTLDGDNARIFAP